MSGHDETISASMGPSEETAAPLISNAEEDDSPPMMPPSDTLLQDDQKPLQSLQQQAQSLTNQALQFLSTASNETIGACLVGLGATTYIVLGRVGLVLMGVVGGVVLHATWEGQQATDGEAKTAEERRRREVGLDVVKRAMAWRQDAREESKALEKVEVVAGQKLDFNGFSPETKSALEEFTDAAIRDYVKWWYSPVLPEEMRFPNAARHTLTAFLLSFSNHVSRKRPATVFLDFSTHSSSILIVFLSELATAISASPYSSAQEAIETYLKAKPDSNLGYVVDPEHQMKKLELVADDVLQTFLEHKAYNCEVVRIFMREVLARLILDATAQSCSRAEWINDWIVYLLDVPPAEPIDKSSSSKTVTGSSTTKISNEDANNANDSAEQIRHRRVVSKAQEAMDDAMREAARLTQMIAEEEAKRTKSEASPQAVSEDIAPRQSSSRTGSYAGMTSSTAFTDDASDSAAAGIHTPTSSQSDFARQDDSPPMNAAKREAAGFPDRNDASSISDVTKRQSGFTTFDQIVPQEKLTALLDTDEISKKIPPPLTLYNATIVLMDDSDPTDRSSIRNKPITEYLIQVEPSTSHHSGWMIVRKYNDFEILHDVLSKIAKVTDARKFAESHPSLPPWKGNTKAKLRDNLERYLNDAVQHQSLAESSGLKRFLEKDNAVSKAPAKQGFPGFGGIETVGKGVVDVLSSAPKGVASGGKAILGGVGSVLGGTKTPKKASSNTPPITRTGTNRSSLSLPRHENSLTSPTSARHSTESLPVPSPVVDTQPAPHPQMERLPSVSEPDSKAQTTIEPEWEATPILGGDQFIHLPPPPTDIPDDYKEPSSARHSTDVPTRTSTSTISSVNDNNQAAIPEAIPEDTVAPSSRPNAAMKALSAQETQVAIELGLASITELYKLSSAWSVRLAFLNAAKAILVRPGNAQLESIRQLIQDTVLDANTSDAGIAAHIRTVRANSLPTETEFAGWPEARTPEQKEELRRKARKLLLERGMPQALNSVMGQAASAEALGKVFDALQIQKVAKGLVFGLMLQALRAVTQ